MEKKSLGRGLNDLSDIFLSGIAQENAKASKKVNSKVSSASSKHVDCYSCINFIDKFSDPKCRIFTFENNKYLVPYMEKITATQANFCKFFSPNNTRETKSLLNNKHEISEREHVEYEVEELVKVDRKIAYHKAENTQKDIRNILLDHLQEGYEIKSLKLRKTKNFSTTGSSEAPPIP